jgi:hypothetical protein
MKTWPRKDEGLVGFGGGGHDFVEERWWRKETCGKERYRVNCCITLKSPK